MANKSWGLSIKTLTQLYTSLIRSLLEYSSIIYPRFANTNFQIIEKIQSTCLKIVYRKSKFESNQLIQSLSTIQTIKERFDELNVNYINKSFNNNNELIIDLYKEYINYSHKFNRLISHLKSVLPVYKDFFDFLLYIQIQTIILYKIKIK
jgi:hypothetical protein